jgi:hypothetical protein
VALSGHISPRGYLILKKANLKFSFRKTDGQLALIDPQGRLRDFAYFHGQAPRYQSANHAGGIVFFGKPTPAAPNVLESTILIPDNNPLNVPLREISGGAIAGTFLSMMLGTGLLLAFIVIFVFTNHHDLSELFLGRH